MLHYTVRKDGPCKCDFRTYTLACEGVVLQVCLRTCAGGATCLHDRSIPLPSPRSPQVAVLEHMLKAVRDSGSGDKVVLVSNYTEALDVLGEVGAGWGGGVCGPHSA